MPEISILMGTYNDNPVYTAQAVDSILGQTFTDFELIIWDDGSETAYLNWLRSCCAKDSRIRLFSSAQNCGLAAVLNRCFSCASGKYIVRMDADDISRADRLEKQAAFLNQHPEYAFAGSNARMIGTHGVWGERRLEEVPDRNSFLRTSPFIHPSVMFRREVIEASGGYCESPKYLRAEDYEFFMRLYAAGWYGYNIQERLLDYREAPESYKKRKYRYRICECRVRFEGFRRLGILKGNLRYALKPLAGGMLPCWMMQRIRKRRYAVRKHENEFRAGR